jgi:hypothetical protein
VRRKADRAEVGEEFFGVGEGLVVGRFEPAEFAKVFDTGGFEGEDDFGEVEALDFGKFLMRAMAVFFAGPEAHADAGSGASGAASALVGGGLADFFYQESVDAAIGVVTWNTSKATVDDAADAVDGKGGFGDVGGDDDFAFVVACHSGVLIVGRKFAVEGKEDEAPGFVGVTDGFDGLGNFEASGHEDENIAFCSGQDEVAERLGGLVPDGSFVYVTRRGGIPDIDGVSATLRFNNAAGLEVIFEARGVERGGHNENLEVGTFIFLQVECAGEGDVAIKMALVELVKDERGDAGKFLVLNDLAEEDAFGDESDPCFGAGDIFKTDLVSDFAAELGFAFEGDASCKESRGESARLKDNDLPIAK